MWKWLAGSQGWIKSAGIVDGVTSPRKVPFEHSFGGSVCSRGECRQFPKTFVERMKPDAILAQRSADCSAKLVAFQVLLGRSEEAPGVENLVSEELENLAVELVAPAFRDDVHHGGTGPLLGHEEASLDLELIDGGYRRAKRKLSVSRTPDANAVERIPARVWECAGQDDKAPEWSDV